MKSGSMVFSAASLCIAALASPALGQSSLGTAFTYQGRLQLSGVVVDDTADFRFKLFDASTGGNQIGSMQTLNEVDVVNGLFTVTINFGATAFNGDARWLEIDVRSPADSGNFVLLTPRQKLNAVPYALKVPGIDGHSLDAADGSPTDALFVDNGGNVGIGTMSPIGKFDVRSGNNSYWRVDSVNGDLHTNGGSDGVTGIYNDTGGPNARTEIILNNQPHLVVKGDGGVGIGTTAPVRRLSVLDPGIFMARFESTNSIGSVVEFVNTPSNAKWELGVIGSAPPPGYDVGTIYLGHGGPAEQALNIRDNDWVGLGLPSPGFRLDLPNIASNDGRGRANQWVTYSSARWKENVQTLDGALDKVMNLRGVSFDWKPEHGCAHDIGFVAEEVGQVVPEIVSWEADGQWAQGLAYDRITALTVEAIKTQQRQIESLQQANAELQEQVATLMARTATSGAASK